LIQNRQAAIKKNLMIRASILHETRMFFRNQGFIELETPLRSPHPIPEAYIEPVSSNGWYLQSSPEQCMKRLIASGYDKIFQICKCFRKNERGNRHLPELTMLEWYQTNTDYKGMMEQCESLIIHLAGMITGNEKKLTYQGTTLSIEKPWERLPVSEAFRIYTDNTMDHALSTGMFDEIMGLSIEPMLGINKPLFLYDYPAEKAALSKLKKDKPHLAERFELYIMGLELCNAFSELNDPEEQRLRFLQENKIRVQNGLEPCLIPEKFLNALSQMPETAGIALGIDRLVMLFTNTNIIDDVTAFTPEEL